MTEQELKEQEILRDMGAENKRCREWSEKRSGCGYVKNGKCTCKDAVIVSTLEKIKQYREIGTVDEIKRMQKYSALAKKHGTIGKVIESCAEYEDIGTVEEFREVMRNEQ